MNKFYIYYVVTESGNIFSKVLTKFFNITLVAIRVTQFSFYFTFRNLGQWQHLQPYYILNVVV